MHSNGPRGLRSGTILMVMTALILLMAPLSHAQVSLDQVVTGTVSTTADVTADALRGRPGPKPGPVSVPEPNSNVLLLLGLGMTGLVAYGMHRRKRLA